MEIEAKFTLPDRKTFQRLQAIDHLAGFSLSAHQIQQVHDIYMDTAGQAILSAGYVCRRRERESGVLITLKALKGGGGTIHRREELEIALPAYQPPAQWPDSPVRERVLQLIGPAELLPLFDLQQTRVFRRMYRGDVTTAEMSLDNVYLTAGGEKRVHLVLEIELAPDGAEEDLAQIVRHLQDEQGLEPETRSKFDLAMDFLNQARPDDALMTPQERIVCQQIATRQDSYGRRAQGLMALDTGQSQEVIGAQIERSPRTVRRWLANFREKRLDIFPAHVLRAIDPALVSAPAKETPALPSEEDELPPKISPGQPETEAEIPPAPPTWTLDDLFSRFGVDRDHARAVADHALALFDHLSPIHGLPPERRALLETAALLHNVGLDAGPRRHHTAGRDILLDHPLVGLDDGERLTLALTTFLHRKKMTAKKLNKKLAHAAFADLSEELREQALTLAALVRIADGLDYSQTGSSLLGEVQVDEQQVVFEVTGPYAAIDAARAEEKSDLWDLLFDTILKFPPVAEKRAPPIEASDPSSPALVDPSTLPTALPVAMIPDEAPERPGLLLDDTMVEAARKTLHFHFQRMLYHEPGTRLGEDIEALHDMRVATRRMRAAIGVFGDYLDLKPLKPIIKGLRRTGRRLGAVRDLDVFWEKTQRYLDNLPAERRDELEPLRVVWETERARVREKMLAYLDGERYARFKERFGEFLQSPDAGTLPLLTPKGEAMPHRLRHAAPVVIYERLAGVLAYDEWVTLPDVPLERLHRLRIAAKRLRYTLEFLEETLAPQTEDLIKQVKTLQDHLGDLQDAVVASALLRDFLTWGTWGRAKGKMKAPAEPIVAPGVAAYMAQRQLELQHLLDTFPQTWAYFQGIEFRHAVAVLISGL